MILAIDSSAGASVAVLDQGRVLAQWRTSETTDHAEVLAAAVAETMRQAGVDGGGLGGVVVGVGPGPFTGLRVGLALAHALAEVWQVPLHGLCSLDSLAHRAVTQSPAGDPAGDSASDPAGDHLGGPVEAGVEFLAVSDARRREVYWARYRSRAAAGPDHAASAELVDGPHVSAASELPDLPAVGIGAGLYPEALKARSAMEASWLPDAVELGQIAQTPGPARLREPLPLYLRESDAKVPAQVRPRTAAS
ncbi:tRNA (adenosine(37)-N6)-threonylcarbamoyltransferase complex dimerization subunit type 1 TsaB [Nesterenkonia sp. Act20]|uniref:tRNA (adenosine(37)-N6)-threonylcarbamoyltransferase complex dimerization subunit type 1 TsaB n=1 Tax=Nesterenkonia sp. Act20 TaxID=1483432 RepID=UPI001C45E18E